MPSQQEHISHLWQLFVAEQATPAQVAELLQYLQDPANDDENDRLFRQALANQPGGKRPVFAEDIDDAWQSLLAARESLGKGWQHQQAPVVDLNKTAPSIKRRTWWRYAAAIIILVGVGSYLWIQTRNKPATVAGLQPAPAVKDIGPGREGAVLTLADGSTIVLDSIKNGVVADQQGAKVVLKDGQLAYHASGTAPENIVYNTMTTPKGRQFHVQLPDGTKVWLNAGSSIRYPTVFTGGERKVEITGEVYFEVATLQQSAGQKIPFKVNVNKEVAVEVLGTHFNVNAYKDDGTVKTTLFEGKVKVFTMATGQSTILRPGQQAIVKDGLSVDNTPDISQVIAWKNGLFNFNGHDIRSVMSEIGRWYDLEIVYASTPKPRQITGKIQRSFSLEEVMATLKELDIDYRLEGRKLIIN